MGKFIEAEIRLVIAQGCVEWRVSANGYRVSSWGDECGDGCTTLATY